ncbi:MAG: superoxide dismutase [Bacilli bacterium]|nr:superoxide dismutase [Bacilli bacterium]
MYLLKELSYPYDSLEPYIDNHTLGLHKNRHQRNYLKRLNELLEENQYDYRYPLEQLPKHIKEFSNQEDILFNLGGVINHDIYFRSMSPKKIKPAPDLLEKINETYSSYEKWKEEFKKAALSLKGSGYTFFGIKDEELVIQNLSNQENPYSHNIQPLIGLDLWEHSYYINYENNKEQYIDSFFQVIDFSYANKIFQSI